MKPFADDLSDEALATAACETDDPARARAATDALLSRYRERIYRWCRRSTRDHEHALDLSQECLLKIYRSLGSFGGRSRFGTWVFVIVRNVCISDARRSRPQTEDDEILSAWIDPQPRPDEELVAKEAERVLAEEIRDSLTPTEQDALWLRCIERVPVDEITRSLDIKAPSGARGVLQTARRKLRIALERRDEGKRP